jgi:hypothetical protein
MSSTQNKKKDNCSCACHAFLTMELDRYERPAACPDCPTMGNPLIRGCLNPRARQHALEERKHFLPLPEMN